MESPQCLFRNKPVKVLTHLVLEPPPQPRLPLSEDERSGDPMALRPSPRRLGASPSCSSSSGSTAKLKGTVPFGHSRATSDLGAGRERTVVPMGSERLVLGAPCMAGHGVAKGKAKTHQR